ncbi:type IV pilus biogenesis/stability protein PilW [Sinimarinibacterium thermocellulolyticum]|uniref:Type IV pilus biogenesis/stability protein PilW n=1 Tax=Sinimarinibacterium thermocellulolyticum TaxID=3170016 RepID=A0ABV2AC33_9GAMM
MRTTAILLFTTLLGACGGLPSREAQDAARINTQLGLSYIQRGQFEVALDKLKRAIKQDPQFADAHAGIAYVYQRLGDPQRAEHHYRKALGLSPDDPALKNNFGVFLCSRDRSLEAERYFLEAARDSRYPTPAAALTNAGRCLLALQPEQAEKHLRKALQIDPGYREALGLMAQLSFQQGDYLRTRAFLQRFDLSSGATPYLLYIAARAEAALGDRAAAAAYEQRLRREFPDSEFAVQSTSDPS